MHILEAKFQPTLTKLLFFCNLIKLLCAAFGNNCIYAYTFRFLFWRCCDPLSMFGKVIPPVHLEYGLSQIKIIFRTSYIIMLTTHPRKMYWSCYCALVVSSNHLNWNSSILRVVSLSNHQICLSGVQELKIINQQCK